MRSRVDHGGAGELGREVEHVADRGGPEGVDGLGVVADHGHGPAAVAQQTARCRAWMQVGVLVLVDEHVVVGVGQDRSEDVVGGGRPPVQEQIVEVEQACAGACARCTSRKIAGMSASCSCTHGNDRRSTSLERLAGVDDPRVDGDAACPCAAAGGAQLVRVAAAAVVAGQLHQVGGVALVDAR